MALMLSMICAIEPSRSRDLQTHTRTDPPAAGVAPGLGVRRSPVERHGVRLVDNLSDVLGQYVTSLGNDRARRSVREENKQRSVPSYAMHDKQPRAEK
jgi:hypothetical protein